MNETKLDKAILGIFRKNPNREMDEWDLNKELELAGNGDLSGDIDTSLGYLDEKGSITLTSGHKYKLTDTSSKGDEPSDGMQEKLSNTNVSDIETNPFDDLFDEKEVDEGPSKFSDEIDEGPTVVR